MPSTPSRADRSPGRRALLVVTVLAAVLVFMASIRLGITLVGALLLALPYALLAYRARKLRTVPWVLGVIALGLASAGRLVSATQSSTGGLIFVWLLPLEFVFAAGLASVSPFRRW
jgi:hypothetical protein